MKKKSLGQQLNDAIDLAYIKEYPGCGHVPLNWDSIGESEQSYYERAAKMLYDRWTRNAIRAFKKTISNGNKNRPLAAKKTT